MSEVKLAVRELRHSFAAGRSGLLGKKVRVHAVDGVSLDIMRGETFGIIGESGCGKSTLGRCMVGLLRPSGGQILLDGQPLDMSPGGRMAMATKIQMIFQDSHAAFDPRMSVGKTLMEPLLVHKQGTPAERRARALALMADVGLSEDMFDRYPHAFSGGQRQRVGIARALALSPQVVVCDEPVSALDMSVQASVLNLLMDLQGKYALTYVFISHNLTAVRHICDRVAVMYLGKIVELADRPVLFETPAHPYSRALLAAMPIADPEAPAMAESLAGEVPSPINPPSGCVFHTRCPQAVSRCQSDTPELREIAPSHRVACHLWAK